jgi:hypothetical protein
VGGSSKLKNNADILLVFATASVICLQETFITDIGGALELPGYHGFHRAATRAFNQVRGRPSGGLSMYIMSGLLYSWDAEELNGLPADAIAQWVILHPKVSNLPRLLITNVYAPPHSSASHSSSSIFRELFEGIRLLRSRFLDLEIVVNGQFF